ncbi:MAG: hypothetical protein OHK0057_33010 [Thermoflexibacter sp.]
MKYIILILASCFFFACGGKEKHEDNAEDQTTNISIVDSTYLCVPCKSVGKITENTSEADLVKWFGRENVITEKAEFDGGEMIITTVFRGTEKQLIINWRDENNLAGVASCEINNANTIWQIPYGIKPSTSLKKLNELNGKPFLFSGFGWDFGGNITDFQGGSLASFKECYSIGLSDESETPYQLTEEETQQVMGDTDVMSDNKVLDKMNVTVGVVRILLK